MPNQTNPFSISVLGSSGGVAKAVLAILNKSVTDKNDPIAPLIKHSHLHLIDINQKSEEYYNDLFPTFLAILRFTN